MKRYVVEDLLAQANWFDNAARAAMKVWDHDWPDGFDDDDAKFLFEDAKKAFQAFLEAAETEGYVLRKEK